MVNPFDHNFFRFLVGFVCILAASFVVLYVANSYTLGTPTEAAVQTGE